MSGRKVFLNNSGMGLSTLVVGGGVTALIIMMIMKIINSATITTTQLDRYDTIQEVRDNIYRNLLLSEPSWQCTVDDLTITSLECLRDGSVNCCTGGPPNIMDPSQECTPPDGNPMAVTTGDIKVYTRSNGTCVLMYDSTVPGNGFTMEGQPCNGYTDNGNPNCPWRADVTWEAACVPPNCRGAQQKLNVEFRYADGVEQWSGSTAAARRQRLDFSGIRLKTETKSNMAFAESMVFDTPTVFGSAPHIFNVPYGVQYIMVEAWGAGGGGGSGLPNGIPTDQVTFVDAFGNPGPSINISPEHYLNLGGGGGGGGAYTKVILPVVQGSPLNVYVGKGGEGGFYDTVSGKLIDGRNGTPSGVNLKIVGPIPLRVDLSPPFDYAVAYGGQGGASCKSASDLSHICNAKNAVSNRQEGTGGVSGIEVEGVTPTDLNPKQIPNYPFLYLLGKSGGKYNSIFNQYFEYHEYYHPPTSSNPTAPINRMVMEFYGGQGGDAGGAGGYGGTVGVIGATALPSAPGGGGAGVNNGGPPNLQKGQDGADGRVIIWW